MFDTLKELARQALYPFLFFSSLFLAAEGYLQWKSPTLREIKPYHTTFTTHDGRRISLAEGPVRLALAPSTLYRNLPNQREPHFTTNSAGLRGPEIGAKGERTRILLLGASTAFGIGAENDDDSFAARLQRLNPHWEVINGAVIGFNSNQELNYFVSELVDYKPDLVITFDAYADIFDAWYGWAILGERKEPHEINYNMLVIPQIENLLVENYRAQTGIFHASNMLLRSILRKSVLLEMTRERVVTLRDRVIAAALRDRRVYSPLPDDYFEEVVAAYVANLLKIRDIANLYGADYLAVFQPELGLKAHHTEVEIEILGMMNAMVPFYTEGYVGAFNRFVREAGERLRAEGIETFNTNEHPRLRYDQAALFEDSAHFNSEGHALMADILGGFLLNRERIQRGEPVAPPSIRLTGGWDTASYNDALRGSVDSSGPMPRLSCGPNAAVQAIARAPIHVGERPALIQCGYTASSNTRGEFALIAYDAHDRAQFAMRRETLGLTASVGETELIFHPPSGELQLAVAFHAAPGETGGFVQLERFSLYELDLESLETQPLLPAQTSFNVDDAPGSVSATPSGFQMTVSARNPRANARISLKPELLTIENGSPVVQAAIDNISRVTGEITLQLGGGDDAILTQRRLSPHERYVTLYTGGRLRSTSARVGWLQAQAFSESSNPSDWRVHALRGGRMPTPDAIQ